MSDTLVRADTMPRRHEVVVSDFEREESIPAGTFTSAFRNHALGVAVVTADPGGEPVAMTVSSLSSVSVDPPLLVFSASASSSGTPVLERAETVVVHMLGADQVELAKLGATSGVDRFSDVSAWRRLPTGEPCFYAAETWLRGRVVQRVALGGSVLHVVHVVDASVDLDAVAEPLVYHNRTWHRLGPHSALE